MRILLASIVLALCFTACGGPSYQSTDPQLRRKAAGLPVLTTDEIAGRRYDIITEVSGLSCARQAGASPSMEAARDMLRLDAAKADADAVTGVLCEEGGTDWSNNCWKTIRCVADAIRWTATTGAR